MREIVIAVLALLSGVVLGGLPLRAEVADLSAEIADLSERAEGSCDRNLGQDLAAFMGGGSAPTVRAAGTPPQKKRRRAAEPGPDAPPAEATAVPAQQADEPLPDTNGEDEVAAARSALSARRAQARAALIEDADPDDAQLESMDAAVEDMNASLDALAQELVDMVDSGQEPTRRDAMVFAAEALDIMVDAEDRIAGSLDPDQLDVVDDSSVDPFSYVDPDLVDTLARLGGRGQGQRGDGQP